MNKYTYLIEKTLAVAEKSNYSHTSTSMILAPVSLLSKPPFLHIADLLPLIGSSAGVASEVLQQLSMAPPYNPNSLAWQKELVCLILACFSALFLPLPYLHVMLQ